MTIKKRVIEGRTYCCLEHNVRMNRKVGKKETYLGNAVSKRIEEIKRDFMYNMHKKKWFKTVDSIRRNSAKERRLMPQSH